MDIMATRRREMDTDKRDTSLVTNLRATPVPALLQKPASVARLLQFSVQVVPEQKLAVTLFFSHDVNRYD
jgi:hypothetical protein